MSKVPSVVVSDMDGTFFNCDHDVPSTTDQLYHLLIKNDIPVITATGRGLLSAQLAMKQNAPNHLNHRFFPGVYHHGGAVYDKDGIMTYELPMNNKVVDTIEMIVRSIVQESFEGDRLKLTICYYCRDRLYTELRHPFIEDFATKWAEPPLTSLEFDAPIKMTDKANELGTVVTRLTVFGDESARELFNTKARECDIQHLGGRITQSLPFCLDCIPSTVTKREGICMLLQNMNIREEDALALGDGGNDVEILRGCGYSYAMGQAAQYVKDSAKKVTLSVDHDGWAVAIKDTFPNLKNSENIYAQLPSLKKNELNKNELNKNEINKNEINKNETNKNETNKNELNKNEINKNEMKKSLSDVSKRSECETECSPLVQNE